MRFDGVFRLRSLLRLGLGVPVLFAVGCDRSAVNVEATALSSPSSAVSRQDEVQDARGQLLGADDEAFASSLPTPLAGIPSANLVAVALDACGALGGGQSVAETVGNIQVSLNASRDVSSEFLNRAVINYCAAEEFKLTG